MTAQDVAARWQTTMSHVHRLAREGQLPVVRVGRFQRFSPAAIERFEAEGGVPEDGQR